MSASPSAGALRQRDALARSQPEAGPWLALLTEVARESGAPQWESAAAGTALRSRQPRPLPLLAGAAVPLDERVVAEWIGRLFALAGNAGPDATSLAEAADRVDARALLAAAINQDGHRLSTHALALAVDPDVLAAIAQLAAVPLLQACRRRLASAVSADWDDGCCPICGAWPALAESRGLQRERRLRCARCGADWAAVAMRCPYCRNGDHQHLGSLISETQGEGRKVDTCDRCRGYVKSVATLRPWAADEVPLADLATVDLDIAALERDFARPEAPAVALDVRLVDPPDGGTRTGGR